MAERGKGTSGGGVITIAAIAFAIGRCSASPSEKPLATTATPASLYSAPTVSVPVAAEASEPVTVDARPAPSEAVAEMQRDPEPEPEAEPETSVYYARCADARAAGAAPIHTGEPGYAAHLDRDGDGVACE